MTFEIQRHVNQLIEKIEEVILVEEALLFGSYAYGIPDEDSDIDLCIITQINGQRKLELLRKARKARKAIMPLDVKPANILIYSKEEYLQRASLPSTLEFKIMNEGVRLRGH